MTAAFNGQQMPWRHSGMSAEPMKDSIQQGARPNAVPFFGDPKRWAIELRCACSSRVFINCFMSGLHKTESGVGIFVSTPQLFRIYCLYNQCQMHMILSITPTSSSLPQLLARMVG